MAGGEMSFSGTPKVSPTSPTTASSGPPGKIELKDGEFLPGGKTLSQVAKQLADKLGIKGELSPQELKELVIEPEINLHDQTMINKDGKLYVVVPVRVKKGTFDETYKTLVPTGLRFKPQMDDIDNKRIRSIVQCHTKANIASIKDLFSKQLSEANLKAAEVVSTVMDKGSRGYQPSGFWGKLIKALGMLPKEDIIVMLSPSGDRRVLAKTQLFAPIAKAPVDIAYLQKSYPSLTLEEDQETLEKYFSVLYDIAKEFEVRRNDVGDRDELYKEIGQRLDNLKERLGKDADAGQKVKEAVQEYIDLLRSQMQSHASNLEIGEHSWDQ